MNGWCGKILRIDLTTGEYSTERPDMDLYQKFIGGRGMAGHYLREHITRKWSDPMIPLLFFTGPLVATASPTSGRMTIMSKSPLTGAIGDSSVGGSLGNSFKKAGLDGLIITGKSPFLCGIEINDTEMCIKKASCLNGLGINKTAGYLKGKGSYAAIGPAAENGVLFSNIIVDRHFAAGRTGLGLIFASKNIKYITVKGSGRTDIFDSKALKHARSDIMRLISASPVLLGEHGISNFGTGALYDLMAARRMMPSQNFQKTQFKDAGLMNAFAYKQKYGFKKNGCKGCHIQCKKIGGDNISIPEFETMSHFSALVNNNDIDTVARANTICNDLGMDTISSAATLACYFEIIGKKTPSPGEIISLLEDIGAGRGTGAKLGKGSLDYASSVNSSGSAMAVKGLELPAYDPRGAYGMALAYAVSTRGGCHLRAYPISHEILRKPVATDRFSFSGKARMIKIAEDINSIADSLTVCRFVFLSATPEEYSRVFSAVTGIDMSAQGLMKIGERICYNERIMNALNGFISKDDDLPERFFKNSGSGDEMIKNSPLNRKEFLEARSRYYKIRGLDQNGLPTNEKAEELGLVWKN